MPLVIFVDLQARDKVCASVFTDIFVCFVFLKAQSQNEIRKELYGRIRASLTSRMALLR